MKNISRLFASALLMIVMISTAATVIAQPTSVSWPQRKPFSNLPTEMYSQMWNIASTNWYFGTVTINGGSKTPTGSNLGRQLDTSANSLSLAYSQLTSGTVNEDTAIAQSLPGYGNVILTASLYSVTGTPTVTVTPMSSSDGWIWSQIPGTTIATLTPTTSSTTTSTSATVKYSLPAIQCTDRFVELLITGDGTNSYSARAHVYWQAPMVINK